MKQILNKEYFLGLFLLSLFLMVGIVSVTNGQTFIDTNPEESEHMVRLHSLFLWNNPEGDSVSMKVNTGEDFLSVQGGFAIGSNHLVRTGVDASSIGGGSGNRLYEGVKNSGIVGGERNTISGKNSLIGGGEGNRVYAENSVIGGGINNEIEGGDNSVIAGGSGNFINGENSVILGGQKNRAEGKNSLVMGQNANGGTGSFAWSANAKENSARIDVTGGVLIGTYNPITGVKLVISGALSLTGVSDIQGGIGGEIRVVNGCIYAHDGNRWQVMGKSSRLSCNEQVSACKFGEIFLSEGEVVDAYENFWGTTCNSVQVKCNGGKLVKLDDEEDSSSTYYPYCYHINSDSSTNGINCDFNGDGEFNIIFDAPAFASKCPLGGNCSECPIKDLNPCDITDRYVVQETCFVTS